ncbi:relaxase MobL [Enterococcus alishanensis]
MAASSPAIIIKAHGSSSVRGFSNYITREEAIKQEKEEIEKFFNYASNEVKTKENGIFNKDSIGLDEKQKKYFVNKAAQFLTHDQENRKYMYKDVISFDNQYLKEKNLINSSGGVDVNKLSKIVQSSYNDHSKRLGMSEDYQMLGAIHLNTDNVHVHIGIVDKNINTKYTRPERSLRELKSKTISGIEKENRINLQKNIDRNRQILKKEISKGISLKPNPQKELLQLIKESLPEDKRLHRMKSNAKSMAIPKQLVKRYIDKELQKNYPEEFKQLKSDLEKQQKYNERLYGHSKSNNSYENKLDRFYQETGNKIFKDLANERDKEKGSEKNRSEKIPNSKEYNRDPKQHSQQKKELINEKSPSSKESSHVKNGFANLLKAVSKSKVGTHAPEAKKQKTIEQIHDRDR